MKSATCIGIKPRCRPCPSTRSTYPIKLNDLFLTCLQAKLGRGYYDCGRQWRPQEEFELNERVHHYDWISHPGREHHAVGTGNDSFHLDGPESASILMRHRWRPRSCFSISVNNCRRSRPQRKSMNNQMLTFSGTDLSKLRTLVAAVGTEIALVPGAAATAGSQPTKIALATTWSNLVAMLDLGSEPEKRECPQCKHPCALGATRCGYCWASLPALSRKEKLAA